MHKPKCGRLCDNCWKKREDYIKKEPQRRMRIGIYTLQSGPFPTILHKKSTVGVSLTVDFLLVLCENYALWSASQF